MEEEQFEDVEVPFSLVMKHKAVILLLVYFACTGFLGAASIISGIGSAAREPGTGGSQNDEGEVNRTLIRIRLGEPEEHEPLWYKTYGEGDIEQIPHRIIRSEDGGFVLTGEKGSDIFILKIGPNGSTIFEVTYGPRYRDFAYDLIATSDGGYLVAGVSCPNSSCVTASEAHLYRTDEYGNLLWDRTYEGGRRFIARSSDGGYILGGGCFEKINENGEIIWSREYHSTPTLLGRITAIDNGEAFVFSSNTNITKIDTEGDLIWSMALRENATVHNIVETSDGGCVGAGYFEGDAYLVRILPDGEMLWERSYGGNYSEYAYSVTQSQDGGFVLVGSTCSYGAGCFDVHVIKVDESGGPLWHRTYGGTDLDWGWDVIRASNGKYIIAADTCCLGEGFASSVYLLCVEE